jgi:ferrochelatase
MGSSSKGVILMNMGGPEGLEDVRPFLFNLFSDREIIRLGPAFLQKFIAWQIARKRAPKSRLLYQAIGGGSPLKELTLAQAHALEEKLADHGNYQVEIAMRYWPPYAEQALSRLSLQGIEQITALTLYPHYSRATTGTSVAQLQRAIDTTGMDKIPINFVTSWPTQEDYVRAVSDNIIEAVDEIKKTLAVETNPGKVEVVYSAHSLPSSFIKEGDPYVDHIKQTIAAVESLTGLPGKLCYQSRSGPVEWLSPSTPEMIKTLAAEGCKGVVMVPISFVSDHVETLYEIDILYKKQAEELGIVLISSKSLNCMPRFIEGLKKLVLENS